MLVDFIPVTWAFPSLNCHLLNYIYLMEKIAVKYDKMGII